MAFKGFRFLRIPCSNRNEEGKRSSRITLEPGAKAVSNDLLRRVGIRSTGSINPRGMEGAAGEIGGKGGGTESKD